MTGRGRRGARRLRPAVERCEARVPLTGIIASMAAASAAVRSRQAPGGPGDTGTFPEVPASVYDGSTSADPLFTTPTGVPTRATRAAAAFRAAFAGPLAQGPGRTSTEAGTVYVRGAGGSTAFLHGSIQLRYIVPRDRSIAPVGIAVLVDRNINNAGELGLDLTAAPNVLDRGGRVRRFSWTVDGNYSAGVFTNAAGQGRLTLRYDPAGRVASVVIRGRVLTQGVGDVTATADLDP